MVVFNLDKFLQNESRIYCLLPHINLKSGFYFFLILFIATLINKHIAEINPPTGQWILSHVLSLSDIWHNDTPSSQL